MNFTSQLKNFRRIVREADLFKHDNKRLVYISSNTLHAIGDRFLLKFRLRDRSRCPKDGFQYLSELSLSSQPIESDEEAIRYETKTLDFFFNEITWGEVNQTPYCWADFHQCLLAANPDPAVYSYRKRITLFQQSDRLRVLLAGLGDQTICFDSKDCDPWSFQPDTVLSLATADRLNTGGNICCADEKISVRISIDNNFVQFNSATLTLTLPTAVMESNKETGFTYRQLLKAIPQFNDSLVAVRQTEPSSKFLYRYHPDGFCYLIDRKTGVAIDRFDYRIGNNPLPTRSIFLKGSNLAALWRYPGSSLMLNLSDRRPENRQHCVVMRDRIYRPPVKDSDRAIGYDNRVVGLITETWVSQESERKFDLLAQNNSVAYY